MATYKVVDAEQLNADMSSVADSIRTKGGTTDALAWPDGYKTAIDSIPAGGAPSLQSKALTITSNGTVSVTPDAPYDALKKVDVTVNVASGGGGAEPATLTITSQIYTGNRYAMFVFVNSEGHLEYLRHTVNPFTFPITIETVLGGFVSLVSSDLPGIPELRNNIGCEPYSYMYTHYILVTNPQASVEMYNLD